MTALFDRANRSFLALLGIALVPYGLLALVACGLLSVIGLRIVDHGLGFLTAGPGDLRAAVVALTVVGIGTVLAVRAFARQVAATTRLEQRVQAARLATPPALVDAAARAGVNTGVDLVADREPFSFAYGLVRPRVAVSQGLLDAATTEQLDAVLTHERYHVRNLDPLKVVLARVLSAAYFFLPALRDLRGRFGAASELAADRQAVQVGGRAPLAGALVTVGTGPEWSELSTAAAIGSGPELLEVRVAQLESGVEPPLAAVSRVAVVLTALTLVVLAAVLVGTLVSLGWPGTMMDGMQTSAGP